MTPPASHAANTREGECKSARRMPLIVKTPEPTMLATTKAVALTRPSWRCGGMGVIAHPLAAVSSWGARSSRPLPSASRRRAGSTRRKAPGGERNLVRPVFGETPNRATETVALPISNCIVTASVSFRSSQERGLIAFREGQIQFLVTQLRRHAALCGTFQIPLHDKIRLISLLDRVRPFP